MEAVLNQLGRRCGDSAAGFVIYEISWARIAPLCCQWSRNRAPDPARVAAIVAHARDGGGDARGYIPPLLHFAELAGEVRPLACFDGNHRREAFAALHDTRSPLDPERVVLAAVMFNATAAAVEAAFRAINAGVSVPELYTRAPDAGPARADVVALAASYVSAYPKFASASAHCTVPNFNRDGFADNVDGLCRALSVDVATLAAALRRLNAEMAAAFSAGAAAPCRSLLKAPAQYSAKAVEKCRAGDLWLFLDGRAVGAAAVAPLLTADAAPMAVGAAAP
jgi:hypothetical protein